MAQTYKVTKQGVIKIVNASELPKYIAMGWQEVKDVAPVTNPYATNYIKK